MFWLVLASPFLSWAAMIIVQGVVAVLVLLGVFVLALVKQSG